MQADAPPSPPLQPAPSVPGPTPADGQFCLQEFSAGGVHEQDEGDHGTSDPRLWIYEVQGGAVVFKTSVVYDTVTPVWPATEGVCLDAARTERGVFCIDVRDDWPLDDPPLLNFRCVPLPETVGAHTVALDGGCHVSFVVTLPPPPSPPRPPPYDLRGKLDVAKCDAMIRDPSHLFRKMWNVEPWWFRHADTPTCFERKRHDTSQGQPTAQYFAQVKAGANCDDNWFEGSPGVLGKKGKPPTFSGMAPALLGFDETIEWFCQKELANFNNHKFGYDHAGLCANSNNNILALWSEEHLVYNLCRNLEWQVRPLLVCFALTPFCGLPPHPLTVVCPPTPHPSPTLPPSPCADLCRARQAARAGWLRYALLLCAGRPRRERRRHRQDARRLPRVEAAVRGQGVRPRRQEEDRRLLDRRHLLPRGLHVLVHLRQR